MFSKHEGAGTERYLLLVTTPSLAVTSYHSGITNLFETASYFCVRINVKGYQFDTHLLNKIFIQFTFNYFSINHE